ncbi:hypothetical protein K7432_008188 [Basidiobolus ranarum]|uniref:Uncharacterized protein n=1 Tax=Basidiobolus ranarum TaxID=34480 RepID=A0ABR2WS78_9FUNG
MSALTGDGLQNQPQITIAAKEVNGELAKQYYGISNCDENIEETSEPPYPTTRTSELNYQTEMVLSKSWKENC